MHTTMTATIAFLQVVLFGEYHITVAVVIKMYSFFQILHLLRSKEKKEIFYAFVEDISIVYELIFNTDISLNADISIQIIRTVCTEYNIADSVSVSTVPVIFYRE